MAKELRLVQINDLHAGSRHAAIPPDWKMNDGATAPATEANHWIYEKLEACAEEFGKPDILIVDGDLVDGDDHLNYAREVWATDPIDQINLGKHFIEMWNAKEVYVIYGSKYHVQLKGLPIEQVIAREVKAKAAGWRLVKDFAGVSTSISHKITFSKSSWQYRTTPLAIQMVLNRLQNGVNSADLILRGHAHYFCFAGFSDQLAMVVPGFQGQTPFMAQNFPELIPKIGMVSIDLPTLDWEARTWDGPLLNVGKP